MRRWTAALVLLAAARESQGFPAAQWLSTTSRAASHSLGLLPFGIEEMLLPGETKQVHLFEARFIQLFADSAAKNYDCLGALLFTPGGNVAAVTTLLEVEEFKKKE